MSKILIFENYSIFGCLLITFIGRQFYSRYASLLYIQSTLVLEVQSYLFVFNSAPFGASFTLFWALRGYFLGQDQVQKQLLEPTYVVNQLWFWEYSSIFLFLIRQNFGPFLPFLGLWGLFLGLRSGSKTFLKPTYID